MLALLDGWLNTWQLLGIVGVIALIIIYKVVKSKG